MEGMFLNFGLSKIYFLFKDQAKIDFMACYSRGLWIKDDSCQYEAAWCDISVLNNQEDLQQYCTCIFFPNFYFVSSHPELNWGRGDLSAKGTAVPPHS